MKRFLITLVSVACLGSAFCDNPQTSSYAVLPYENEVHHQPHHGAAYGQPSYEQGGYYDYNDYGGGSGKKGFSFGRVMKAPMKALKGAGNYMRGMFDDVQSKFLELKGSILKAKGSYYTARGHNILVQAYGKKAKDNILYPVEYYNPGPQHYNTPYDPLPHEHSYAAINPHENQYDSHGHNLGGKHNVHPEPGYTGQVGIVDAGHGIHEGSSSGHGNIGHHSTGSLPIGAGHGIHAGGSSGHDNVGLHSAGHGIHEGGSSVHNNIDLHSGTGSIPIGAGLGNSISSYATVPHQRREFIEQRSSRRRGGFGQRQRPYSGRTQRAYNFGPIDDPNPIPVPVPIPVYPSRLVFPSMPGLNLHGGHH